MGCLNDLTKINNATNAINALAARKNGKTPEQCKCIDFFFAINPEDSNNKKKGGCFSKKSKKKKKGCGCFSKESDAMTMDDYLAHVQKMVNELNLKQRAIEKIGLDESQISEIPPIVLYSFRYRKQNDSETLYHKSQETKIGGIYTSVTNKYQVTWIFFSATQLYTHTYEFDTTSNAVTETTRDFFYSDITCIRTVHEIEELILEKKDEKGCGCTKKKESKFVHCDQHYDTLQITVPNDSYFFCCKTNETIEQSIQAAKAMIREKKQA